MEQEYTTSTGYKLLYGSLAILLILSLWMYVYPGDIKSIQNDPEILTLPLLGIIPACLVFINLYKRKVIINHDSIQYVNIWGSKKIINVWVKGFRITNTTINIQSSNKAYPPIRIKDYFSLENNKRLIAILNENFTNLDKEDFESNKEEMFASTLWDLTQGEKEAKILQSKKIAKVYTILGLILFIFTIIFNYQDVFLSLLFLLYPLVGIALMIYSKGLIKLYKKKNNIYSSIFIGLFFASIALIFQATNGIDILDYNTVVRPVFIATVLIFVGTIMILIVKLPSKLLLNGLFALLFAITYAFGSLFTLNTIFDTSKPYAIHARVLGYDNISERHAPILIVTQPGQFQYYTITAVGTEYKSLSIGTFIDIKVKKGLFNIPWTHSM